MKARIRLEDKPLIDSHIRKFALPVSGRAISHNRLSFSNIASSQNNHRATGLAIISPLPAERLSPAGPGKTLSGRSWEKGREPCGESAQAIGAVALIVLTVSLFPIIGCAFLRNRL